MRLNAFENIATSFNEYFEHWEIRLPRRRARPNGGAIRKKGWHIQYLFGTDDRGEFLDFYAVHRMTNDRHCRIRSDGTLQELDAYLEWTVYPPNATEEQEREAEREYRDHNERVRRELQSKGFS